MRISDWSSDVCSSDLFTKQAGRSEQQYEDQQAEGDDIFVLRRDIGSGKGFRQTQKNASEHGAGNAADTAQHRSGERLNADDEADERIELAYGQRDQYPTDRGQHGADDEGEGNNSIGVDAQQVRSEEVYELK